MNIDYEIEMEISGNTAIWTRPDTGDCPVSYPAPTYSAVKGIFESILWGPAVMVVPFKVEICKPLRFHSYATNYNGPLRKSGTDGAYQFLATVLTDVSYRMYAYVYPSRNKNGLDDKAKAWDGKTTSPGHAYAAIFNRRLKRGQWFTLPCLGWKEFTPSYVGPFREGTKVQEDISTVLPSMLREVFPDGYNSEVRFTYDQNVPIEKGVLIYPLKGLEVGHD
ncbi:MAG: CRISPR-associated protein Cas5 [Desulfobacterales bacterium]|jgi:CRISPR-associated protein Cas5d|nr:CRISPR-associated protein Cas5 [Desulfobacterales bacterium]